MKKIVFMLVMSVVLFSVFPVKAMETKNYSGSATSNSPWILDIVTLRQGDLTTEITWTPRRNVNYVYQVFHYTDPNNVYNTRDYDYNCVDHNYDSAPQILGNWTCDLPNAPAGYYRVYFRPYNGGTVYFNLSVTAETNP